MKPSAFNKLSTQDDVGNAIRAAQRAIYRERNRAFTDFLSHVKTYVNAIPIRRKPYLFISYAWEPDKETNRTLQTWLTNLAIHLRALGMQMFLDTESMTGNFTQKMRTEVEKADWVLSICTPTLKQKITQNAQGNVAQEVAHAVRKHATMQRLHPDQVSPWLPLLYAGSIQDAVPKQVLDTLEERAILNANNASLETLGTPYIALIKQLIPTFFTFPHIDPTYDALCDLLSMEHAALDYRQRQFHGHAIPTPLSADEQHQRHLSAFDDFLRVLYDMTEKTQYYSQSRLARAPKVLFIAPPSTQPYAVTPLQVAEQMKAHLQAVGVSVSGINQQEEKSEQQLKQQIEESDYVLLLCHPDFKQQAVTEPNSIAAFTLACLVEKDQYNPDACLPILYQGERAAVVPDSLAHIMAYNVAGDPLLVGKQHYSTLLKGLTDPVGLIPTICGFRAGDQLYEALLKRLKIDGEHLDKGIDLRSLEVYPNPKPMAQPQHVPAEEKGHGLDDAGRFQVDIAIPFEELTCNQLPLGAGRFGTVYQGSFNRAPVAIKQLNGMLTPDVIEKLKEETAIMMRLRSPHIVQLYGICLEPAKYAIVMELMKGGSLYNLLHNGQPLDWDTRYKIAMDITTGIYFLHQKNIIHRDLKSLNILLDQNNHRAKISDFGLSKIKQGSLSVAKVDKAVGTIPWMAPEILNPQPKYSKASDIFAYAVVLWELLTRETPWEQQAGDAMLIPAWVVQGTRLIIPETCPQALRALIETAWDGDVTIRPTAKKASEDMEQILKQKALDPVVDRSIEERKITLEEEAALKQAFEQGEKSGMAKAKHLSSSHFFKENGAIRKLQKFFQYVACGDQDHIKEMLAQNPELALVQGNFDDISDFRCLRPGDEFQRIIPGISGFQYAIWALDYHMLQMMIACFGNNRELIDRAMKQYDAVREGRGPFANNQYGSAFDLHNLINALVTYENEYRKWSPRQRAHFWCETVGKEQRKLPTQLMDEYRRERPFHPIPTCLEHPPLPRECGTFWFTVLQPQQGNAPPIGKLGESWAALRGNHKIWVYLTKSTIEDMTSKRHDIILKHMVQDRQAVTHMAKVRPEQIRSLLLEQLTQHPEVRAPDLQKS